jgi:hypothetical protein
MCPNSRNGGRAGLDMNTENKPYGESNEFAAAAPWEFVTMTAWPFNDLNADVL